MKGERCRACETTIAKPEHAEQAKVTPLSDDAAIREGKPKAKSKPLEPWPYKNEPEPGFSIRKFILSVVIVFLAVGSLIALLTPSCLHLREAAARSQTFNNMRQIALACHHYHDFHKALPSPRMVTVKDGKNREVALSWRVAILRSLDEADLQGKFDVTVGWDHENNAAMQDSMLSTFRCPRRTESAPMRTTYFQYFTGPNTVFPDNAPRKVQDIPDGSSRTILFADAQEAVIWSRPADMAIRPGEGLPVPNNVVYVAFADATVRLIQREQTNDKVFRQLIDPNDGEPKGNWE